MNWKKIGLVALAAFLIYFLVVSPVESANAIKTMARTVGDFAHAAATSFTTFLSTLF